MSRSRALSQGERIRAGGVKEGAWPARPVTRPTTQRTARPTTGPARQVVRMTSQIGDRAGLLAAHRPVIEHLLRDPTREQSAGALCGYVVTLTEPTGYLIAVGLAQRHGELDPDPVIRAAVNAGACAPILIGIVARAALAAVLVGLAPATRQIALALEAPDASPEQDAARALRVVVAAGGGAELFFLTDSSAR